MHLLSFAHYIYLSSYNVNNMKKLSLLSVPFLAVSALVVHAQMTYQVNIVGNSSLGQVNQGSISGLQNLMGMTQQLVVQAGPLLIGIALLSLFYGIIMFIWKGRTDEKVHTSSIRFMSMSILALFVMVAVWGIIGFISGTFGIGLGGRVPTPGIPTTQSTF